MSVVLADLLERCRRGENEAIVILIARFQAWAIDFAATLLHDRSLAEDAVQEAFMIALQRLPELQNPAAFPGLVSPNSPHADQQDEPETL